MHPASVQLMGDMLIEIIIFVSMFIAVTVGTVHILNCVDVFYREDD